MGAKKKKKTQARARPLPKPARSRKRDARRAATPEVKQEVAAELERPSEKSRNVALLAAKAGLEKKASGVEIIDVTGKVDYADYLVLMTGQSHRNVVAIADAVDATLAKNGIGSISIEGLPAADWVLVDFVDVVVHVFHREARALYDLDGLWMDARRVPLADKRNAS